MSGGRGSKMASPACAEVLLERGPGDLGDRAAASVGFMAESRVQVVGELYGRSSHVCQHTNSSVTPAGRSPRQAQV
jgi:hypothetical protein